MVHRDIAARNFLVSLEGRILISDFGLSRSLTKKNAASTDYVYLRTQRTDLPVWSSAPEGILQGRWTDRSDVWSFGKNSFFFHFFVFALYFHFFF